MGSISQKAAVPLSPRRSKKRKRRHQEDYDEDSSPIFLHRRRRRSRSRTPSPSPSLAENDNIPEKDATANLPASLDRHACQRCLKFLASEPDFECEFPARSTKCTRCTRLKDKCEPIPTSADAKARVLSLQAEYEVSSSRSEKPLRRKVVVAAEDFAASVRMAAHRRPKTATEINLALLNGQEEIITLLRGIKAELTAQGREEKRKEKAKGRD